MKPAPLLKAAPSDIFSQIRDGYRFVASHAARVKIHEDRLKEFALSLQPCQPANTLDENHHYKTSDPEALAAYILSLEAVNFGSGYKIKLLEEGWAQIDGSIYFTISTALKTCFEQQGPWTGEVLRHLTVPDIRAVFGLPDAPYGRALASLWTISLNELGLFMKEEFNDSFMALLEDSNGLASRFVPRLGMLPGFQDVANYRGRDIEVFKRAQHAAASLHGVFSRIGLPLFGDMDRMTMFADNAVPHVLRLDGLLEYDDALARQIDSGVFLAAGSDEEIEIRCCAGEVVERLAAIKGMKAVDIDYILWHRSVEDSHYRDGMPHQTLTRFY